MSAQSVVIEGDCPACQGSGVFLTGLCTLCKGSTKYTYRMTGQFIPYLISTIPCECGELDCIVCPQIGG